MVAVTSEQKKAMRDAALRLWPDIGDYCVRHGATGPVQVSTGQFGIPVDRSRITAIRGSLMMTQQALADAAGCSRDTLVKIENGKRNPSVLILENLARLSGQPVTDLLLS